ncbi:MAG TPA: EamA family transporter [Gaiellaceae bacterium]|nr:EamA family transporter [Gaiellaceae bacterium]
MTAAALALTLAAAVLHAGWNVLLAGARDVRAATTGALGVSVLLFAPLAAATWRLEAEAVPWLLASSALELAYFGLLTAAYRGSDVSLVYPIARGAAPVLVLAGASAAGQGVGGWQAAGVLLVGAGVALVPGARRGVDLRGILLGLAIAATIAGYTLVDKQGIEHASPLAYLELVLLPVAALALLVGGRPGLARVRAELGLRVAGAAVASFSAYALVLGALSLTAAPAVAAVRETSVLCAVALGALVLGERVGRLRTAGAALVAAGAVLVAAG